MVGNISILTAVVSLCLLGASLARPADEHDDEQFVMEIPVQTQIITLKPGNDDAAPTDEPKKDTTRDIIEKIKQINQNLKKPHRKHYYTYQKYLVPIDNPEIISNSYDEFQPTAPIKYSTTELLEKIKQVNENQRRKSDFENRQHPKYPIRPYIFQRSDENPADYGFDHENILPTEDKSTNNLIYNSRSKRSNMHRQVPFLLQNPISTEDDEPIGYGVPASDLLSDYAPMVTFPKYIMVPLRSKNSHGYNYVPISTTGDNNGPLLKQFPSLPSIPWPLAPFFPILIKDPFLAWFQAGNLNNVVEYGQSADVCNRGVRKTKPVEIDDSDILDNAIAKETNKLISRRASRAMKLRSILPTDEEKSTNIIPIRYKSKKSTKISSKKPSKITVQTSEPDTSDAFEDDKESDDDGDLRFSEFGLFGNKKPLAPSPGFFINRLKVRRGGVAIAGPGGVATAGRGGTAIVGPGGLAYTQPGGLAVAGPSARVVALSSDIDLNQLISRLRKQQEILHSAGSDSTPRDLDIVPGGKLVATGPVVYYHETEDKVA